MTEEMIVRYCSPTLAGLKTGNIFSCPYESINKLRNEIYFLNRRLTPKGLRILPLRISENNALIYVYRPARLKKDLSCEEVSAILEMHGYVCNAPEKCIARLIERLRDKSEFPHEIGLFLGYPPEDVRGFIENNARCAKCVGYWKVYGDEEKAKQLFAKYKKCTESYMRQLEKGNTII